MPFPLYHPHLCNTSFSTYWNRSPPQLASRSLSQLTILFRATQHLQNAPGLTVGRTAGVGKFGCPQEIPDLSVRSRDEHPGFTREVVLLHHLSGVSCHPCRVLLLPKSSKIQEPQPGDAEGWGVTAALDVTWERRERGWCRANL